MNIVTRSLGVTHRPLAIITGPSVRLPIYMRVMLLVSAAIAALVVAWTIPSRLGVQPSNPFSDYAAILPGQSWDATAAVQFSCDPDTSAPQGYCTRAPASGPFSLIGVTVSDGVVSRVNFAVREGALTVGDLALLWGRPNARLYGKSLILEWPDIGVTANGWAESGRFSYFIPVIRLSFGTISVT